MTPRRTIHDSPPAGVEQLHESPASPLPDALAGPGAGRRAGLPGRGRPRPGGRDIGSARGPGGGGRRVARQGGDQRPPLRQRHRHDRRRVRGHDPRRAAEQPAGAAPGRGAGVRAGRDRHAALGRRQGQPVFPARLQPGSRHRLRDLGRRHAGEHGEPCARPGLQRPELAVARTGRSHRLSQGSLLREERRLRSRRLGLHRVPHDAGAPLRRADAGPGALPALRRRRLARGRQRAHAAGRRRAAAQRRPMDGARGPAQEQRRAHAEQRQRDRGLEREPDGLRRALDFDRPDPAAPDRCRQPQRPALRPLRFAQLQRRRTDPPQQPLRRMAPPDRGRHHPRVGLRDRLRPHAVLGLHLRDGAAGPGRPVLAAGPSHHLWPQREPHHRLHARGPSRTQRVRPAAA